MPRIRNWGRSGGEGRLYRKAYRRELSRRMCLFALRGRGTRVLRLIVLAVFMLPFLDGKVVIVFSKELSRDSVCASLFLARPDRLFRNQAELGLV